MDELWCCRRSSTPEDLHRTCVERRRANRMERKPSSVQSVARALPIAPIYSNTLVPLYLAPRILLCRRLTVIPSYCNYPHENEFHAFRSSLACSGSWWKKWNISELFHVRKELCESGKRCETSLQVQQRPNLVGSLEFSRKWYSQTNSHLPNWLNFSYSHWYDSPSNDLLSNNLSFCLCIVLFYTPYTP